jgi:sterol desaturase/sphingolipid hydroxylase (fatty acid hydroxylase superfamily)
VGEVDWLSNERMHPLESVINAIVQAGTLLLGFAPAAIGLAVQARNFANMLAVLDALGGTWTVHVVAPRVAA